MRKKNKHFSMRGNVRFNQKKYDSLMLYIIFNSKISIRGLQYAMYRSDFLHYAKHNKGITGETYRRQKSGITGDHFDETLNRLFRLGKIKWARILVCR